MTFKLIAAITATAIHIGHGHIIIQIQSLILRT
jgi:hypothetical protein